MTESSKEGKGGLKGFIATVFLSLKKVKLFIKYVLYQRLKLQHNGDEIFFMKLERLFKYAGLNSTQLNIDLLYGTLHI